MPRTDFDALQNSRSFKLTSPLNHVPHFRIFLQCADRGRLSRIGKIWVLRNVGGILPHVQGTRLRSSSGARQVNLFFELHQSVTTEGSCSCIPRTMP